MPSADPEIPLTPYARRLLEALRAQEQATRLCPLCRGDVHDGASVIFELSEAQQRRIPDLPPDSSTTLPLFICRDCSSQPDMNIRLCEYVERIFPLIASGQIKAVVYDPREDGEKA